MAICACIRCLATSGNAASAHLGQIFNGLAGPFVYATPSRLSAAWFPPSARTKVPSLIPTL
jgi:hypothetical protein